MAQVTVPPPLPQARASRRNAGETAGPRGAAPARVWRQGAHSATSLAWDEERGETVVVKALPLAVPGKNDAPAGPARRFQQIGRILSGLDHPGLVRVHRCEERDGLAIWVMEQIDGLPLDAEGPLAGYPPDAARLRARLGCLLEALAVLHDAGLIHRDLKPANILVCRDGRPVLIDFDAAMVIGAPADGGESSLTPGFAAPEQYVDGGAEGPWTDLYGLGAVAWWLVTGETPPDALSRLQTDTLPPASGLSGTLPDPPLLAGIGRALCLDPNERPQSAREWLATLDPLPRPAPERGAGGSARAGPIADDGPPTIRVRRRPAVFPATLPPVPAAVPAPAASPRPRGRRAAAFLGVLTIAASAWGGALGWEYYLTEVKSVWVVDAAGRGDVRTITEAFATAKSGAVIKVRPGTYTESLTMDRARDLQGEGPPDRIILAPPPGRPCLVARAPAGAVRGLTLRSDAGPHADDGDPVPCILAPGGALEVAGNRIGTAAGAGLFAAGDAVVLARNNRIEAAGPAFVIAGEARAEITENDLVSEAHSGIVLRSAGDVRIAGNRLERTGAAGILIAGGEPEVVGNRIAGSARSGIEIRDSASPQVGDNIILGAGEAGVFIHGGASGTISGNTVTGSTLSGIVVAGGSPQILGNRIEGSGEHGLFLLAAAAGRLAANTIVGNGGYGIARAAASPIVLGENTLRGNREPQVASGEILLRDRRLPPPERGAAPTDDPGVPDSGD